nr:immunoglobulin heavy chain junction region [Mus musculus]MBK4186448.1 immunoglobulin heavy chain junction region [Mus musculus]MBK4186449.1 immunoglobulin heavy chain junction region [Mus musculus]MBK4186452.1 immunoglobulin heavy chain junction region [Mus musculus]MBK4196120.1 immunoglobulin heavy chain junction region [Mus musculus]
CARDAMDYW